MAYQTYITDALVCGVKDSNTSDRSYLLFTREAGMLFANARSVRLEKSRQRYALQEFSLVRVTLIKGKSGWRIGSVEATKNFYQLASNKAARGSVVDIFRQLRRFIHGEEASVDLYDFVLEALQHVSQNIENRKIINKIITVQFLHTLGYISNQKIPESVLMSAFNQDEVVYNETLEKKLDTAIETAVSASQL